MKICVTLTAINTPDQPDHMGLPWKTWILTSIDDGTELGRYKTREAAMKAADRHNLIIIIDPPAHEKVTTEFPILHHWFIEGAPPAPGTIEIEFCDPETHEEFAYDACLSNESSPSFMGTYELPR